MSKKVLINKHQEGIPDKEMPELKEEDFSKPDQIVLPGA